MTCCSDLLGAIRACPSYQAFLEFAAYHLDKLVHDAIAVNHLKWVTTSGLDGGTLVPWEGGSATCQKCHVNAQFGCC